MGDSASEVGNPEVNGTVWIHPVTQARREPPRQGAAREERDMWYKFY